MKKHYIILAVVLLLVVGVAAVSLIKYERQPKDITLKQALAQRDNALINLKTAKQLDDIHQQGAKNQIDDLTGKVNTLNAQQVTLCTQIKTAKLTQPLCK